MRWDGLQSAAVDSVAGEHADGDHRYGPMGADAGAWLITWTASSDPALGRYVIRMTPGPVYDAELDSKIGEVGPGITSFMTLTGLESPGNTASYRVFVILTSGNESGSNSVGISRP